MATPVRQYSNSIDHQMLENLKYSGIAPENLADLVGLFVSIKNKYGLVPFAIAAESNPIPNAVTACRNAASAGANAAVSWDTAKRVSLR